MVRNRKVNITTNNVEVRTQTSPKNENPPKTTRSQSRRRRRRGPPRQRPNSPVAPGVQTGLANVHVGERAALSTQSKEFANLYNDPCGEHTHSLDAGRVPDGALQFSCAAFFRFTGAIKFPFQTTGDTDLTGKTYSLLIVGLPLLRNLCLMVVLELGGEFTATVMNNVSQAWSILSGDIATYPNWLSVGDVSFLQYMSLIDTAALRNIIPPGSNGVSGTVDSYRFSTQGLNFLFNTPDLINQGTLTVNRYPTNFERKTMALQSSHYGPPHYARFNSLRTATDWNLSLGQDPTGGVIAMPQYVGTRSTLPSPIFIATVSFTVASSSFAVVAGQSLHYIATGTSGVALQNITTTATMAVVNGGSNVGDTTSSVARYYITTADVVEIENVVTEEFNVIAFPPVTQGDMLQQNPKTSVMLAKDYDGGYVPCTIFEPVFKITHSTNYAKTLLVTSSTDLHNELDYEHGWFDSVDQNFGLLVFNAQEIPYACKPQLKFCRSVEMVPAPDSLLGAFVTGAPVIQPEIIDVVKSMSDELPMVFPPGYNMLGILHQKICAIIEALPRFLRSGRNIASEVATLCEQPSIQKILSTGVHRLARTTR
jgi:hypothetical protein